MSQSIGIPGFVNERKDEINALSRFKDERRSGSRKRDRITMYRTRSFMRYGMSRAVRQRRMQNHPLYSVVSTKPKLLFRRQRRVPGLLQSAFTAEDGNAVTTPASATGSGKSATKAKKGKRSDRSSKQMMHPTAVSEVGRLNTHIWHVKRFFMTSAFDWSIPIKHRNRGLKAVDGLLEKCVLQDISYYLAAQQQPKDGKSTGAQRSSIRVSGQLPSILALLKSYTDPRAQLAELGDDNEDDSAALAEAVETEVVLFERGRFPAACIGPAALLFVPQPGSSGSVEVWVSCHPAIAATVYEQLCLHEGDCTVALVLPRCNRFRLRGQEASQALLSLLRCPPTSGTENEERIRYTRALLILKSPSKHVAHGQVVAVDVLDPRNIAELCAEAEAQQKQSAAAAINKPPARLNANSALFSAPSDAFHCPKDHVLNERKHQQKVQNWQALFATTDPFPAVAVEKNAPAAVCPVLLIRKEAEARRFNTRAHQLSGWDVVVPAAWGGVVFAALQLRGGAAVVGSEEMEHLQAKCGVTSFPRDFPDTATGRRYWEERHRDCSVANSKRPPRKQTLVTPLASILLEAGGGDAGSSMGASSNVESIHEQLAGMLIVRGESYLRDFRPPPYEDLERAQIEVTQQEVAARTEEEGVYAWASPYIAQLPRLPPLMFLQVLLFPTSRGMVHDLAEIVLPSAADVTAFVEHKVNTQRKRDGKRATEESGRAARQLQEAAKHKGLYGRQASAGSSEDVKQDRADPDLDRNWAGVKLRTQKCVPCNIPLLGGPVDSPAQVLMDVVSEPAAEKVDANKVKAKKVAAKSKARESFVNFEIGHSEGRRVIGTVTSGQQEHLNNTHFAVGLCNVNALNELFRRSYGRHAHPQAHLLVLFRNTQSEWLRPALLRII